jgi:threonine dehydrogenase-like Zn-dependent dehydrogenase
VDFESAAFVTLGAIALHGFHLADASLGERVAVIGLGLLGLLTVGIARAAGCQVIGIDIDPWRVERAADMGADLAILRDQAGLAASAFTHGQGFDAVLICADSATSDPVELAGEISRDRARVVAVGAVGLNLPRRIYYQKELTFINSRSYGPGRYDPSYEENGQDYPIGYVRWTEGLNMEAFVDLLASNRLTVKPLITHRFPIEQAPAAYEMITGRATNPSLGVLLTYSGETATDQHKAQVHEIPTMRSEAILRELPDQSSLPAASILPEKCQLGVLGAGNFATAVLLPALRSLPNLELVGIASASGFKRPTCCRTLRFSLRHQR